MIHVTTSAKAALDEREISGQEFILEELRTIKQSLSAMNPQPQNLMPPIDLRVRTSLRDIRGNSLSALQKAIMQLPSVVGHQLSNDSGQFNLTVDIKGDDAEATKIAVLDLVRAAQHKNGRD